MVKKSGNNNFPLRSVYQIHDKINLFCPDKLYVITIKKLPVSIVLQVLILPINFLQYIAASLTFVDTILSSIVAFHRINNMRIKSK